MSLSANIMVLKCHVTYLSAFKKNENRPCNHEICFLHPMILYNESWKTILKML